MRTSLSSLILTTVAYADVFSFPPTEEEIVRFIPSGKKIGRQHIRQTIAVLVKKKQLMQEGMYVVFPKRSAIIQRRTVCEREMTEKLLFAFRASQKLCWIPTVEFVGLTGSAAMGNALPEDDIDLLIITSGGTVWVTRFLATLLLELFRMRRRPGDTLVANKICLNMFLSEHSLEIKDNERDLYTAHEVVQMFPLWDRAQMYVKFLRKNRWVSDFFRQAWKENIQKKKNRRRKRSFWGESTKNIFQKIDGLFFIFQRNCMGHRRTNEIITSDIIRFHPADARIWVRKKFEASMKKHNVPLDKNFFHP